MNWITQILLVCLFSALECKHFCHICCFIKSFSVVGVVWLRLSHCPCDVIIFDYEWKWVTNNNNKKLSFRKNLLASKNACVCRLYVFRMQLLAEIAIDKNRLFFFAPIDRIWITLKWYQSGHLCHEKLFSIRSMNIDFSEAFAFWTTLSNWTAKMCVVCKSCHRFFFLAELQLFKNMHNFIFDRWIHFFLSLSDLDNAFVDIHFFFSPSMAKTHHSYSISYCEFCNNFTPKGGEIVKYSWW